MGLISDQIDQIVVEICPVCNENPVRESYVMKTKTCSKECSKIYFKQYDKEYCKTEKYKAMSKKWRENNKDKLRAYNKEYNSRPEVKIRNKKYHQKYYKKNKVMHNQRSKEYYWSHKEKNGKK